MLAHFREMAAATDVPLNADFENGFADDPDGVAENVARCIATGVAGLSIEDLPKNDTPLYDFDTAVARVKAARAAIDRAGGDVVFTARAENFLRGVAISTMLSGVSGPTRQPAPIAFMRRASRSANTLKRW